MKIALNKCFGGFCVSAAVYSELGMAWDGVGDLSNKDLGIDSDNRMEYRSHPELIEALEKVGEKNASGEGAQVRIVEIPDGIEWEIHDDDGVETAHEKHRSW